MKTSIALIGFMGTGKTAVGKVLAGRLGKDFVETDALIEQRAGRSIPEIFRQDGEITFREMEIEAVRELAGRKNAVVACGGGIILNKINVDRLKQECIIVYLTASPGVILKRTAEDENERPLLATSDRAGEIARLLSFRRPFYQRAADIKVATSRLDTAAVAGRIIEKLREYADYG